MTDFELRLQPVLSMPVVLGIAALLVGLLWVRPRHVQLSGWKWSALVGLRLLVVLLTLVAMLRPTLVYTKSEPVEASLVVLVDGSRSMQVADSLGDRSRWNAMKLLLDSATGDLEKLGEKWDVSVYEFSGDTRKLDVRDGQIPLAETPDGEQSAVGSAVAEALDRETGGRVMGMLLLSDGAQRATPPHDLPPQAAARRLAAEHVPLYTFTFGQPGGSDRADLAIDDLVTNETVFAETPTEVHARLTADGYANQQVRVQLLWEKAPSPNPLPKGEGLNPGSLSKGEGSKAEMEVVDTVNVDTGVEGGSVPIRLRHTPKTPGEYKVVLRVEPREGELVTTNNEAGTFVTVRAGGINVLYLVGAKRIGGGPGQEQRFVRAGLAQSPDIVVERRLINYDPPEANLVDAVGVVRRGSPDPAGGGGAGRPSVAEGAGSGDPRTTASGNPRTTAGLPDVILLDDVDAQGLSVATWRAIAERVKAGAGLMMMGGYHSFGPGGFREGPLADVLPIEIGAAQRQLFNEAVRTDVHLPGPVPMRPAAPLGVRHPIMQIDSAVGRALVEESPRTDRSVRPTGDEAVIWGKLPPLDGANRILPRELKPNAQVLAETDNGDRHPLLVAGQFGEGRVLAFAGDSTWRWQMAGFGEAHRRFWRQAVLWLAKKDEQTDGRVWIRLAGRRATRGARVDFEVGAENAQGAPIDAAEFEIVVQTPDGRSEPVRPTRGAVSPKPPSDDADPLSSESRRDSATWAASFRETGKPGDYRIKVTAKAPSPQPSPDGRGSVELGTAEARFLVPNHDLELDRPAAEPSLMAQLAEMTKSAGGSALAPEELPALLKELAAKPPELKEDVVAKVTYWDRWPFFLAFVGCLSVEWFLRKRWGLV